MSGTPVQIQVLKDPPPFEPVADEIRCSKCPAVFRPTRGDANFQARSAAWAVPRNKHDKAICPACLRGELSDEAWATRQNEDLEYRKARLRRERLEREQQEEVFAQGRRPLDPKLEAVIERSTIKQARPIIGVS